MGCGQSRPLVAGEAPGAPAAAHSKGRPVAASEPAAPAAGRDSPTSILDVVAAEGCYKPDSEKDRLQALLDCKCLDTPDERRFDSITALVKDMFQVPIAVVGLIDDERLWLKSIMGVEGRQGRRLHSFCDASLRAPNPTMMMSKQAPRLLSAGRDTQLDARFHGSQFVCESPYVRFYTGAPLVSSEGHILGSLGIMDIKPRSFPAAALNMICNFAELVVRELERDKARELAQSSRLEKALGARGHIVRALSCFQEAVMLCNVAEEGWPILYVNDNWCSDTGFSEPACLHSAFWDLFHTPLDSAGSSDGRSMEEAIKAALEHKPFSIVVEGGHCSRVVLELRPATADHLSAAMPTVGIPNFVEGLAPSELKVLDSYFFAIIRQPLEPQSSNAASASSAAWAPSSGETQLDRPAVQQRASLDTSKSSSGTGGKSSSRHDGGRALASFLHPDVRSVCSFTCRPFGLDPPESLEGLKMGPLLGKGAYGKVYRGTWKSASVAVKIMEAWVDPQSAEVTQPMLEALLSKNLAHPHVVQTFEFAFQIFEPDPASKSDPGSSQVTALSHDLPGAQGTRNRQQQVWLVQQYCNHGTLGDAVDRGWLRTRRTLEGAPCMHAILPTAQEIASALQYLHSQDVIHGDLAPGNVLLVGAQPQRRTDPRSFQAKVGDFGLSRLASSERALRGGTAGTVSHMPPEVVDRELLTKSADVYSFGVLCYEMVSGRRAWAGRTGVQILIARSTKKERLEVPPGCPPRFKSLVESCLRDDHTQRPTFDAIVGELEGMMRELGPPSASSS